MMSRIPAPSSSSRSRSPLKPAASPAKAPAASSSIRTRTQSTAKPTSATPVRTRTKSAVGTPKSKGSDTNEPPLPPPAAAPLSIKEAIALKRAEAKKAQAQSSSKPLVSLEDADPMATAVVQTEDGLLGRWSIKETIERGRSSGSVNLSTRSLVCLPSALFEIHLGLTPDPLKSVPEEPPLPEDATSVRRPGKRDAPAWFEAQDLQILKAWNNEIREIQHEISLFGSLKVVDLHNNKLERLPNTLADLSALTVLDLSHNTLTSLPDKLFSLPELTTLNISHNNLTALPLNAPFADGRRLPNKGTGSLFTPAIQRSITPLPRLLTLEASHNEIPASAIDLVFPHSLIKIDFSANPLGEGEPVQSLFKHLGSLPKLKDLRFEHAKISDDALPSTLFVSTASFFPVLCCLDLGETKVTPEAVKTALKGLKQSVTYDLTTEDPPEGTLRIIVGKRIIREAWEIELERKAKERAAKKDAEISNKGWEFEAEQGLTEGAKRRIRATEATASAVQSATQPPSSPAKAKLNEKPKEVVKEAWEIEAEQGLLTEGGRRRARAAAVAVANENQSDQSTLGVGFPSSRGASPILGISSLSSPQYYSQTTNTLTLPSSVPPAKMSGHARAFSVATPSLSAFASVNTADIAVPTPTLPLTEISAQSFAPTLKVLSLANRRMDKSISLPTADTTTPLLPCLEELSLEGCNLADSVPVARSSDPRSSEPLLPLLSKLFPSLQTLDLSYNILTSASITSEVLTPLIIATPQKKGLKHLRLRGNKLTELDGMRTVAEMFKGNREVEGWKLDELDLRDNEIGKLPAELGLLPLDVFLVDGNMFRVPARRIWEREGTKGLLSWLRGRIE